MAVIVPPPFTPAFWRTLLHAVLNDVIGRIGSFGRGFPKANTNHCGRHSPNRRIYQAACASSAAIAVSFSGIEWCDKARFFPHGKSYAEVFASQE